MCHLTTRVLTRGDSFRVVAGFTPSSIPFRVPPVSQNNNERKPVPVGQEIAKTPADRVRLIQEMQRAAEATPVQQAPAAVPLTQTAKPAVASDAFAVKGANPIQQALAAKTSPTEVATYAKLQKSAASLFGNSTDLEVKGNPWKVIPFGDVLPGLFDDVNDAKPVVPEKAVQTPHGQLFELGLAPKGSDAPTQKRAVLVNDQGQLAGALCRSPQDATRLLTAAKWLLPAAALGQGASWKVTDGTDSAFALELTRGAGKAKSTERLALDNFGRLTTVGRKSDLDVASYFLDRFEASV